MRVALYQQGIAPVSETTCSGNEETWSDELSQTRLKTIDATDVREKSDPAAPPVVDRAKNACFRPVTTTDQVNPADCDGDIKRSDALYSDNDSGVFRRKVLRRFVKAGGSGEVNGVRHEDRKHDGADVNNEESTHHSGESPPHPNDGATIFHSPLLKPTGREDGDRGEVNLHNSSQEQRQKAQRWGQLDQRQQQDHEQQRQRRMENETIAAVGREKRRCAASSPSHGRLAEWRLISATKIFLHGVIVGIVLTAAALFLLNRYFLRGATGFGRKFQSPPPT